MALLEISWDPKKARANLRKHKISFTEAATALQDDYAVSRPDRNDPERTVMIGYSMEQHLLVVVHIEYIEENWVRIISARKANKKDQEKYARGDADE